MNAGYLIQLTDTYRTEKEGTKGVLVNAPSDENDNALCIIFENGHYSYLSSEIPFNVIGYAPKYVESAEHWETFVSDVSANGLGVMIHVLAWQYNGGGGFDWVTDLNDIQDEYEQEKKNTEKLWYSKWECCLLEYVVSSLETATDEIDRSLWENSFDSYPNHHKRVLTA